MSLFDFAHPSTNLLSNFDEELQDFYLKVLPESLKNGKKRVAKISSKKCSNISSTADLKSHHDINAYVFRYSPCFASAVANHFLGMVNSNPLIFRNALLERCVKICCLGGGSASEVVAISKIFTSAQDWFWLSGLKPMHLQVTVVDSNQLWEKTAVKVLHMLKQTACFFDRWKMAISFRFLCADFTKPLNNDVKSALNEADIVTMVKFLSVVRLPASSSGIGWLVQDIAANMKSNAVLFYLDTNINKQCNLLHTSLQNLNDIKCIYGPIQLEPYTLTMASIHRCIELFWQKFANICMPCCIINACAWIKSEHGATGETEIGVHPLQDLKVLSGKDRRKKIREIKQQWAEQGLASWEILAAFDENVRQGLPKKVKKKKKKKKKVVKKEVDYFYALIKEEEEKVAEEERDRFFFDYPEIGDQKLFQTKSKNRRISLEEFSF